MARMSVRVFAWTICDSMCGDDEGIYSPGIACMRLTIVWSWCSYLDLRATADERTDLGVWARLVFVAQGDGVGVTSGVG